MKHYRVTAALVIALAATTSLAWAEPRLDIRVAAPWEISGADPATDGYTFLRMGVMETLVDADSKGVLEPGLATGWEASEDGLTWRFSLRAAPFHDGTPLTAEAAANALTRAAEMPGPFGKAPVETVGADGNDVVITLSSPFAALPAVLAHSSTVIPAPAAFAEDGKVVSAIGTGPFKVATLEPPQKLETERFESYWGEPAKLDKASYQATKRAETRALMAESQDADLVFTLDPSGFKRLGALDTVKTHSVAIPRVMLVKVNASHPALDSAEARKALSLAIDRDGIAAGITRFPEAGATQIFPPALSDWHDPSLPALAYDPDAAKALLAEQGWVAGEDGILTRDGNRFELTMRTFPDRPELPLVAAALQDQWRQIGVDLDVSVSNYSEIPAGHQDGSLDVALFARNYGVTADPIGSVSADFGAGGGDWGAMNWEAPSVAKAVTEIAATANPQTRKPLIREVAATLQAELPLIPVVWYQHTVSVADGLDGVEIDPLERSYGLDRITWSE